jgi:ABC transporter substrate binding protein
MMRRRDFITLLGGAAGFAARGARATNCNAGDRVSKRPITSDFRSSCGGLSNGVGGDRFSRRPKLKIEFRWAEGQFDQLPLLAADLLQRPVNLMVAAGGAHVIAKAATSSVPIVFTTPGEPVSEGLVKSLNRPGGNATGVSLFSTTLEAKRFELSKMTATPLPRSPRRRATSLCGPRPSGVHRRVSRMSYPMQVDYACS